MLALAVQAVHEQIATEYHAIHQGLSPQQVRRGVMK